MPYTPAQTELILRDLQNRIDSGASAVLDSSEIRALNQRVDYLSIRTSTFNVVTFGAAGDGTTDDTSAIQATIAAAIAAGGGTILLPAGTYLISDTLDFSALAGTLRQVTMRGVGAGGFRTGAVDCDGSTLIVNDSGGTAIKAYATNGGSAISGLRLEGFSIQNTGTIGDGVWTIDWDGVYAMGGMKDIIVQGAATGTSDGNGIRVANPFNGQLHFENVIVAAFADTSSIGFRIATEDTAAFPGGVNSGNCDFTSCLVVECYNAWEIDSDANVLNGCTFNACKAVGTNAVNGPGFRVGGGGSYSAQHVFNSCHSEAHSPGFYLYQCKAVTVNSPIVHAGSPESGRGAIEFRGSDCAGNSVHAALVQNFDYGVWFREQSHDNFASAHSTSAFLNPAVTTLFQVETGGNAAINNFYSQPGQAYGAYVPALTATGGNPNIGATGTITGRYTQRGNLVQGRAQVVFNGAGLAAGTGQYRISAPVEASSTIDAFGYGYFLDSSTGFVYHFRLSYITGTTFAMLYATQATLTETVVSATLPAAPAAGDIIGVTWLYEAA